jgi:hypothetical protein
VTPAPRRSALRWRGAGEIAFLGSLGSVGGEGPPQPEGPDEAGPLRIAAGERVDASLRSGAGADAIAAAEAFLEAGGGACWVAHGAWAGGLGTAKGTSPPEMARAALAALADRDDAGTIVLLGDAAGQARELALETAARRDDIYILIEGRGGDAPSLVPARENAATMRFPPGYADALRDIGLLAASLRAGDFSEEMPFLHRSARRGAGADPLPGVSTRDREAIRLWRRREGLRRSLDRGTRWALLEANRPFLRRRIEREVTAFLRRMEDLGLLDRGVGFSVECSRGGGAAESGRIELDVKACLAPLEARRPVKV